MIPLTELVADLVVVRVTLLQARLPTAQTEQTAVNILVIIPVT